MRSYNGLFDNMLSDSSLTIAFMNASKGKRNRNDVQRVLKNLEKEKENLKEILETESLELVKHKSCIINEVNCHKERQIVKPYFKYEQVVHHLIVAELKPIIMKGFYEYSCGSIPNRGCHYGKKFVEKWLRSYPKDEQVYVLKMDIRHFFENIDHDILKSKLRKVIRDQKFLRLLFKVIDNHEVGLPLGYYTSQWLANFYLKDFDHSMKEKFGAVHYIRYMDDMVIIDTSKDRLHKIRILAENYLESELKVSLKDNWQVFPVSSSLGDNSGRPLDFMGFKFYRNYTSLRKSILFRVRKKSNSIYRKQLKGVPITVKDATGVISYMGWLRHTCTYKYYLEQIKPKVIIGDMKRIVSLHQRKENEHNDRVEKCKRLSRSETPRSGAEQLNSLSS